MAYPAVRLAEKSDRAGEKAHRWKRKASARKNAEQEWDEVARFLEPEDVGTFCPSDAFRAFNPMRPVDDDIWDSEPQQALDKCASVLETLITPTGKTWHKTIAPNEELNQDHETREYLQEADDVTDRAIYGKDANFVASMQTTYRSIAKYGNGYIQCLPDWRTGAPRFVNIPIGQGYPTWSHDRRLTGFDRYFQLTALEAARMFEALPEVILAECEKSEKDRTYSERKFGFLHVVEERWDFDADAPGARGMAWESHVVALEGEALVVPRGKEAERGYYTNPYVVGQWRPNTSLDYPRGPGGIALPAIRLLNAMARTDMISGEIAAHPPVWVPNDGVFSINYEPGSIVYGGVNRDGKMLGHTLPFGDPRITPEKMEVQRQLIRKAFLNDWFQLLQENPRMTAYEVAQRILEKSAFLAPPVGLLQDSFVAALFDRALDVVMQLGLMRRPMPRKLFAAGGAYGLEFDSPITDAQRADEGAGFVRTLNILVDYQAKTGDTRARHVVNPIRSFRSLFRSNGTPEDFLNSDEEVAALEGQDAAAAEREAAQRDAAAVAPLMTAANAVTTEEEPAP